MKEEEEEEEEEEAVNVGVDAGDFKLLRRLSRCLGTEPQQ